MRVESDACGGLYQVAQPPKRSARRSRKKRFEGNCHRRSRSHLAQPVIMRLHMATSNVEAHRTTWKWISSADCGVDAKLRYQTCGYIDRRTDVVSHTNALWYVPPLPSQD